MVLYEWIQRLGDVVAPDEKYEKEAPPEDSVFSILDVIAPDPNFTPSSPEKLSSNTTICVHCNKPTPIDASSPAMATPSKNSNDSSAVVSSSIRDEIVQASIDTLRMNEQSKKYLETFQELQQILGRDRDLNKKTGLSAFENKLTTYVRREGEKLSLREGRTYAHDNHQDQGLTLLHLAAKMGHFRAIDILLQDEKDDQLAKRSLLGWTAFHFASHYGQEKVVEQLREYYPHEPVDLIGHTAFATMMVSPMRKATANRKKLEKQLFSKEDSSILLSSSKPMRTEDWSDLGVVVASADIVGKRILSEDSCNANVWKEDGQSVGVVCVCDGHGDQGLIAKFLADNLHYVLQKHKGEDWEGRHVKACQDLEDELKKKYPENGGSCAISALVTPSEIVVSNVGDSRCILIQKGITKDEDLTQAMANLSLGESQDFTVTALSNDHRVIGEELERIKKAGGTTREVKFTNQKGETVTEYKLEHKSGNDTHTLSTSRSFGDFELKASGLVCTPEVHIHKRDFVRDSYLVIACDGVWDLKTNEAAARIVMEEMSKKQNVTQDGLEEVAQLICKECIDSGDNVTVAILALGDIPPTAAEKTGLPPRTLDTDFASPAGK